MICSTTVVTRTRQQKLGGVFFFLKTVFVFKIPPDSLKTDELFLVLLSHALSINSFHVTIQRPENTEMGQNVLIIIRFRFEGALQGDDQHLF